MAALPPPVDPVDFHRLRGDNSCDLAVGGRLIRLPHRRTQLWLAALGDQALHEIFPQMLARPDRGHVHTLLADPRRRFDVADMRAAAKAIVAQVTGFPWYVAVRLANTTGKSWVLADSLALLKGVDLLAVPVRRTLSVVYLLQRDACKDDDDRAMLDRELWAMPDGEKPAWTPTQQASSFAAFRAATAAMAGAGGPPGGGGR